MQTVLAKAEESQLEPAARLLQSGEIVAVPTETVYGLAANALNVSAVRKIFAAKGRPQDNPLIFHISDLPMLYEIAKEVPPIAKALAKRFWPGPLTMIFPRKEHVPAETCGGLTTMGVRMPNHAFTLRLIRQCGFPLAAPSANTSGLPSPTTAVHVFQDMNGKIPLILDGGECRCGVESTVISFEKAGIRILRPGAVTPEQLGEFAEVWVDNGVLNKISPEQRALSPGMKYKHYSPKAEVYIIDAKPERFSSFLAEKAQSGRKTAVLCGSGISVPSGCVRLPYGDSPEEQAERLFTSLRTADELNCLEVYAEKPKESGLGLAVYNRLLRAAAFRVLSLSEQEENSVL